MTDYFSRIEKESSRLAITRLLAELLAQAHPTEAQIITYFSLGLLRAPYHGTQFALAEKSVAKVLAEVLDRSVAKITEQAHTLGDLGLVAATGDWRPQHELSVTDLYNRLVALEELSGSGSQEEKAQALGQLLHDVLPLDAQYIIRIILGKLRLGFSDMTMIDALSWMITGDKSLHDRLEHAYNLCADLGVIAALAREYGVEGLDRVSITVGIPIRPAAAERLPNAQAIIDKIGDCVAQPKLDGFRLQIHIDHRHGKRLHWFFSRNLIDMSEMFPDLIEALEPLQVQTLIAEGEALVYDEETDSFVPFQETVKRKRKHGIEAAAQEMPLKLILFDILYLNGESLLAKTHHTRRDILCKLFEGYKDHRIVVVDEKKITTAQQLEHYFYENISAGLEGLVVKKPDSRYQPGKRNFNWIKLKRQEHGELEDTIDAVILGYYYGSGKRASFGIGAFLVGLYDPKHDRFETVAKVGTGLKDADWRELKKKCDAHAVAHQPKNVVCAKELAPDVWVAPEMVCAIRADEITQSPIHTAGKTEHALGYALRFPRFMGYRIDKSPTDATTVHELQTLFKHQKKIQ